MVEAAALPRGMWYYIARPFGHVPQYTRATIDYFVYKISYLSIMIFHGVLFLLFVLPSFPHMAGIMMNDIVIPLHGISVSYYLIYDIQGFTACLINQSGSFAVPSLVVVTRT